MRARSGLPRLVEPWPSSLYASLIQTVKFFGAFELVTDEGMLGMIPHKSIFFIPLHLKIDEFILDKGIFLLLGHVEAWACFLQVSFLTILGHCRICDFHHFIEEHTVILFLEL